MYTNEYLIDNAKLTLDISMIDKDDYYGNGWALLHLTLDGEYIKGLHYVDDDDFKYTDYIAEYYIGENDMILFGKIDGYDLKVTDLLK